MVEPIRFQSPSLRGSGRFENEYITSSKKFASFNPLHCGAVVASPLRQTLVVLRDTVSIPFIAGQWSLQAWTLVEVADAAAFQSPSLRGSGRFARSASRTGACRRRVSIPFIAGQWSLLDAALEEAAFVSDGFNPLHCGAVVASLRELGDPPPAEGFQSPSLRGSGRFAETVWEDVVAWAGFNPLHCGAVVASLTAPLAERRGQGGFNPLHCGAVVASDADPPHGGAAGGFNPLHCGAVVASTRRKKRCQQSGEVSIPFIAGQWSLLPRTTPFSFCRVLLRKRRLPCDHIICTRLPF